MNRKSNGKINLGLKITGKRENGYHTLESVMIPINYCDNLCFEKSEDITIIGGIKPIENDIIYKAIMLLKNRYNVTKGIKITVLKNIPIGSGLGGGSSNAALTLEVLNELWDLYLSKAELYELAHLLGSDVPFYIENKPSFVSGTGEEITLIDNNFRLWILLVIPPFSTSTKEAFEKYDKKENKENKINDVLKFYQEKDFLGLINSIKNDLDYDEEGIKKIKTLLLKSGATNAFLTGSGSCVYSLFTSEEEAFKVKENYLKKKNDKIVITYTL